MRSRVSVYSMYAASSIRKLSLHPDGMRRRIITETCYLVHNQASHLGIGRVREGEEGGGGEG